MHALKPIAVIATWLLVVAGCSNGADQSTLTDTRFGPDSSGEADLPPAFDGAGPDALDDVAVGIDTLDVVPADLPHGADDTDVFDAEVTEPTAEVLGKNVLGGVELAVSRQVDGAGVPSSYGRIVARFTEETSDTVISPGQPASLFASVTDETDGCVLLRFEPGECDPPCSWEEVCVESDTCQPWPTPASVGPLTVSGLAGGGPEAVEITPYPPNYLYLIQDLPTTFMDAQSEFLLEAPGADVPAFKQSIGGVAPMTPEWAIEAPLALPDDGATVTWEPADDPEARVRVTVLAPNSCHGCPYHAQLLCEGPDNGSLSLPAELVSQLPEIPAHDMCFGYDCPKSSIERFKRLRVPYGQGELEIVASSRVHFFFERMFE